MDKEKGKFQGVVGIMQDPGVNDSRSQNHPQALRGERRKLLLEPREREGHLLRAMIFSVRQSQPVGNMQRGCWEVTYLVFTVLPPSNLLFILIAQTQSKPACWCVPWMSIDQGLEDWGIYLEKQMEDIQFTVHYKAIQDLLYSFSCYTPPSPCSHPPAYFSHLKSTFLLWTLCFSSFLSLALFFLQLSVLRSFR